MVFVGSSFGVKDKKKTFWALINEAWEVAGEERNHSVHAGCSLETTRI